MGSRTRWILLMLGVAVLAAIVIAGTAHNDGQDNGLLGRWGINPRR